MYLMMNELGYPGVGSLNGQIRGKMILPQGKKIEFGYMLTKLK